MTVLTETIRNVDFIAMCRDPIISIDEVSATNVSTTAAIDAGTVMGKITATGVFVPFDQDASDGSENAAGILMNRVEASATAEPVAVVARNCAVIAAHITWPSDIDAAEQTAAETQLLAANIVFR